MLKLIFSVFILFLSTSCFAGCWKIGEFSGYSARAGDKYEIKADGLTGRTFMLQIAAEASALVPSDLTCKQVSSTSLVCISSENHKGVVETWSVDPKNGLAFHTKSISGYGMFDGANLFVGKILGSCG
ncbi:hypothetical protein [Arsukibacterium indicum]|uniref:Lipoprotein n=1 Tax=Arsukibacterium indicum TaxID=2848612 RepID=A0ABS6MJM5_9GAMM|nr:hypothetical protein [Arsukibacterium indicum]MBV2129022.1 hypothetical protein [Arsukibacterium indicum]